MMVHAWDTILVVVKIVDNETGKEFYLDPEAFVQSDRWSKHADMCQQFAHCLKEHLVNDLKDDHSISGQTTVQRKPRYITSENISVYVDVWCSLNGRFQQRMYDPNYDLLKANWSPFRPVEWLLPLLNEYTGMREKMVEIQEEVYSWSNYSDVLFIADFPGMQLENYISKDLTNITLTVLEGAVIYEFENEEIGQSMGVKLSKGDSYPLESQRFHRIHTVSETPACYMYTYVNGTKEAMGNKEAVSTKPKHVMKSPFPLLEDVGERVDNFLRMVGHISNSFLYVMYHRPLVRRSRFNIVQ